MVHKDRFSVILAMVFFVALLFIGDANAQKLSLIKKHPTAGTEWNSRFGLSGQNKPAGFYYRMREQVANPNLQRSKTTEQLQLIVSEPTAFGAFGLFRSHLNDDVYKFILTLYNKDGKIVKEFDLCKITDEYALELQDIRYENGRFYFNMACPTYSEMSGGKCSRLYCLDVRTGSIIWKSDNLISNDIFVLYDNYIISSYGFTNERDFVYLINKSTGEVECRMSLDAKAQYIEVKEEKVYVIDVLNNVYVFQMQLL